MAAVTVFLEARQSGTRALPTVVAELQAAISSANTLRNATDIAESGAAVPTTRRWAPQAAHTALLNRITAAQTLLPLPVPLQADFIRALTYLNLEIEAFSDARQWGEMPDDLPPVIVFAGTSLAGAAAQHSTILALRNFADGAALSMQLAPAQRFTTIQINRGNWAALPVPGAEYEYVVADMYFSDLSIVQNAYELWMEFRDMNAGGVTNPRLMQRGRGVVGNPTNGLRDLGLNNASGVGRWISIPFWIPEEHRLAAAANTSGLRLQIGHNAAFGSDSFIAVRNIRFANDTNPLP